MSAWDCVRQELNLWGNELLPARLWLRDDDAVDVTKQFEHLVRLTEQFEVPVTVAVIPRFATDILAKRISNSQHISVAQHGHAHINHAPSGEKKCELGLQRGKEALFGELVAGHTKLNQMFGDHFISMLVPPWNRIDRQLVPELAKVEIESLSAFGWKIFPDVRELIQLNTHVDIIDWKGSRGGRPIDDLIIELAGTLKTARQEGGAPVGILSHHLVHDEAAWAFLQQLFQFCKNHRQIIWCHATSLPGESDL